MFQICPQHADEEVDGLLLANETWQFSCGRRGHVTPGPFEWIHVAPPPGLDPGDGIMGQYHLLNEMQAALISVSRTHWVEYGLIERAYAERMPDDFAALVDRYGHTAIAAKQYTVSALLSGALARLTKSAEVLFCWDIATASWAYNGKICWYAVGPTPPDPAARLSCGSTLGYDVRTYVPGVPEVF